MITISGAPYATAYLSDGTFVWADTNGLHYTTDYSTYSTITTTSRTNCWLGVDGSDNIYVIYGTTSVDPWIKGTGHTWSAGTTQNVYNDGQYSVGGQPKWVDFQGTNSKGFLVAAFAWEGGTSGQWGGAIAIDCGALLAGVATTATTHSVANSKYYAAAVEIDTNSNVWVVGVDANEYLLQADYYTPSSSYPTQFFSAGGTFISMALNGSATNGGSVYGMLDAVRVAPGVCIVAAPGDSSTHFPMACLGTTATPLVAATTGIAPFTFMTGSPPIRALLMPTSGANGKVWMMAPNTTPAGDIEIFGVAYASGALTVDSTYSTVLAASVDGGTNPTYGYSPNRPPGALAGLAVYVGSTQYIVSYSFSSAPNAPTLLTPTNASYEDVSSGQTFTQTYNSTDAADQNAYAARIKLSGAASYSYYNASTNALQSTIVWNAVSTAPAANWSYTIPAAAISNGNTYNWSSASQESLSSLQGVFASDFTFNAQTGPALTVISPAGGATTATPSLGYTATPASGSSITGGRWLIYTSAQSSIDIGGGTIPSGAISDVSWTSNPGTVAIQSGVTLNNSTTYYAYAAVSETGTVWSSTISSPFTTAFDQPATPTITATAGTDPTTSCPLIEVTVQGHDNLLSLVDASFEGSLGTWTAGANTTIAVSSAESMDGSDSMSLTATATGAMSASTASNTYAVVAGEQYSAIAYFRAAATAESCTVAIDWYTSSGTLLGSVASSAVTDTTTSWTKASLNATAPATAAYAAVTVNVSNAATSEVHYVDEVGIFPGTVTTWSRGGLVGLTTVTVTRSDGLIVRGANGAPIPTPSQTFVVDDYEVVSGTDYTYTAVISANIGSTITSDPDTSSSAVVNNTLWWILDPTNPSSACAPQPTQWNPVQLQQTTAHLVLGQNVTNIVGSVTMNPDFNATFELFDNATYNAFEALLALGKAVFISNSAAPADSGYYIVGPQSGGLSMGIGVKSKDTQLLPSTSAAIHRTVAITAVAAARPTV